jgi:heptosyltransferase-2
MARPDEQRLSDPPEKVLILQTAFLGDVILTLPLIQAAGEAYPGARICPLVIPATHEVLRNHPAIDHVLVYDKRHRDRGLGGLLRMSRRLRREGFDLALIPHRSLRSALLATAAGIPRRVGFSSSAGSFLLNRRVPRRKDVHEVERNLDLLRAAGIAAAPRPPRLYPGQEDREQALTFLKDHHVPSDRPLVGLAPGSVWATKRWLPDGFAAVIRQLLEAKEAAVVLLGGSEDRSLCRQIARLSGEDVPVAAGELSILGSAALIELCRLVVSNDSAAAHLTVAVGRPVVAIFGPTVPGFGFAPYGDQHLIVEAPVDCRPCGVHGPRRCPRRTFDCMRNISPVEVLQAVRSVLGRGEGKVS